MRQRPAHADSLDEVLAEAFRLLGRGVADRRSAFHSPTLATVDADGAPHLRTVVLRGFEAASRRLTLHSDHRSAKLGEIAACPRVALHVYDRSASIQLRLDGVATVHVGDGIARDAWARSAVMSGLPYAIDPAPGTPVSVPPDAPGDTESGAANFAVLTIVFERMEWLWLSHAGHRRAAFSWRGNGEAEASWLVP